MRILVVDDEQPIADLVEVYLKYDGYEVCKCYTGQKALDCLAADSFDLAILDVMLPDVDGYMICQKIRQDSVIPVIMLTAKIEDTDKITGLAYGADDYITKPFNPMELMARVKTQLRRYKVYNQGTTIEETKEKELDLKGLVINYTSHKCSLYGKELSLTPIEFEILWYLCEHRGKVVSSEELFEAVWKERYLDNNNTVMAHVARLREKLKEPPRNPKYIKTVWGIGYVIE